MRSGLAGLLDVSCVLVFIAIGRATHEQGAGLAGYAGTVWPFLAAAAAGWAVSRAWRRPEALWPTGITVWAVTTAAGMALRALTGGGTATAFVIVATLFLAATMLGWRLIAQLTSMRRVPRQG